MRSGYLILLAVAALLLTFPSAYAQSLEEQAIESLRFKAQDFLKSGDIAAAKMTLDTAREQARTINDTYTRVNNLRYIGLHYTQCGEKELARESFNEAMGHALTITPWNRRMSGVIGVVELQRTGDKEGTRFNAMRAINAGILELPAENNAKGETGRFLAALDGILYPMDFAEILVRLRGIGKDRLRLAALVGLEEVRMLHETQPDSLPEGYAYSLSEASGKGQDLVKGLSDAPHANAEPLEKILWLCATARLHAIRDSSLAAGENIKNARAILRNLPRNQQELPERVTEKTVELLALR